MHYEEAKSIPYMRNNNVKNNIYSNYVDKTICVFNNKNNEAGACSKQNRIQIVILI